MVEPIGAGSLFQDDSHSSFMKLTNSRYNNMMERLVRKKLIVKERPPFTCDQYRKHILLAMNGKEDGYVQCRYCRGFYGIKDIATDHAIPLDRRGSVGLDNLEYPCRQCNLQKGKCSPEEFLKFLAFLETIPLARVDILARLAQSVQLAAGQRSNAGIVADLKQRGEWKAAQARRLAKKKSKAGGF